MEHLTARQAARKWASSAKAIEDRPMLSRMVRHLCDEHETMQTALARIAAGEDDARGLAVLALATIEKAVHDDQ